MYDIHFSCYVSVPGRRANVIEKRLRLPFIPPIGMDVFLEGHTEWGWYMRVKGYTWFESAPSVIGVDLTEVTIATDDDIGEQEFIDVMTLHGWLVDPKD